MTTQVRSMPRTQRGVFEWWPHASLGVGAGLMLLAWLWAYPIIPNGLNTWAQFPLGYWVGLVCVLGGAARLVFSERLFEQVLAVLAVGISSVSPQLFFFVASSDSIGLLALFEHQLSGDRVAFASKRSLQWPSLLVWMKALGLVLGVGPEVVLKVGLVLFVCVFMLGALWLMRSGEQTRWPALAATLPIIAGFLFLNWQFAYQPMALALMLVALAMLLGKRVNVAATPHMLVVYLIAAFLISSHAFVALWFVAALLGAEVTWRSRRLSPLMQLGLTVLLMHVGYVLYVSSVEFQSFVQTLSGLVTSYRDDSELTLSALRSQAGAAGYVDPNPWLLLTKFLAFASMACAALLLLAGVLGRTWGEWSTRAGRSLSGLMAAGLLHFVAGLFINVIGARGLQLLALGSGFGVGALERWRGWPRQGLTVLVGVAFVLFSATLFRTQIENKMLLTPGTDAFLDRAAGRLAMGPPREITGESLFMYQLWPRSKYRLPVLELRDVTKTPSANRLCGIELATSPIQALRPLNRVVDQGDLRIACKAR